MQTNPAEQKFRGYAGIVRNTLLVLNDNALYKRRYGRGVRRFLCNSPHWQYAALIIMEEGSLRIDAVANEPKMNLRKEALGWDGFVEMDSGLFVALITDRLSLFGVTTKWLTGRVKLKGIFKLIVLWDVFLLLKGKIA